MSVSAVIYILFFSYFLGSIPFGYLLTALVGLDVREVGSGNIGATNVLRTGRKELAVLTLFLDWVKGAAAVMLALAFLPAIAPLAGLAALIGHMFPIWLKFKGGKGVATAMGVVTALAWPVGLAMMITWLAIVVYTRISSLGALIAIGAMPVIVLLLGYRNLLIFSLLLIVFIFAKHEENIRRLMKGTEPKIMAGNASVIEPQPNPSPEISRRRRGNPPETIDGPNNGTPPAE